MVLLSGIMYAHRTIKGKFPGEEMMPDELEINVVKDSEVVQ